MGDEKVILLQSQSAPTGLLSALLRGKESELLLATINAECGERLAQYA